jgi:hypothetical protein
MPMRKMLFPTILIATIVIAGCGAKVSEESVTNESVSVVDSSLSKVYEVLSVISEYSNNEQSEMQTTETKKPLVAVDDFETWGYQYEVAGSTYYYVVVKNNSELPVAINGYAVAKDSEGKSLDESSMSIDVLGPGETTIEGFLFNGIDDVYNVEYELDYDTAPQYKPILGDLDIEYTANDKNISISVMNNGEYKASCINATCLFFDENNNVIDCKGVYINSEEFGVNSGETAYDEIELFDMIDYDHVEVYFNGYGEYNDEGHNVAGSDIDVKKYGITDSNNNCTDYYLVITNNTSETISISGSGVIKDYLGNMLDTWKMNDIDVVAPGESTIGYMYFNNYEGDVADMEYAFCYKKEEYYQPVVGNFETNIVLEDSTVTVSVTNNGNIPAEFVFARVLFFDDKGFVVGSDGEYMMDGDCQIKVGGTLASEFTCDMPFDHVEVYYKGRG